MFGVSIKSTSQFFSWIWPKRFKIEKDVWKRLSTFSMNTYLSMIGVLIFFLISKDVSLGKEYQYKNQAYNKCVCDEFKRIREPCPNEDGDDFQNNFVNFPIQNFVLSFSIVSIACHVIHSLVVVIPPPVPMMDFILGLEKDHDPKGQETRESYEMTPRSPDNTRSTHEPRVEDSKCKRGWTILFKLLCIVLTLSVVGFLIAVPYLDLGKSSSIDNSGCPTKSNERCTFPFVFDNVTYYGCSKDDNEVIHFYSEGNNTAKAWCAINAEENGEGAKSYEICEDNCPGGTNNHHISYRTIFLCFPNRITFPSNFQYVKPMGSCAMYLEFHQIVLPTIVRVKKAMRELIANTVNLVGLHGVVKMEKYPMAMV